MMVEVNQIETGLQRVNSESSGLFDPVGVNFNPTPLRLRPFQQMGKCNAISDAGINCGEVSRVTSGNS